VKELREAGLGKYQHPSLGVAYVAAPVALLTDGTIGHQAKRTFLHLLTFAKDGVASVGLTELAKAWGRDESTCQRHLNDLGAAGYLQWPKTPYNPATGKRECNIYTIWAQAHPAALGGAREKVSQVNYGSTTDTRTTGGTNQPATDTEKVPQVNPLLITPLGLPMLGKSEPFLQALPLSAERLAPNDHDHSCLC
jgi:hypothetical protein